MNPPRMGAGGLHDLRYHRVQFVLYLLGFASVMFGLGTLAGLPSGAGVAYLGVGIAVVVSSQVWARWRRRRAHRAAQHISNRYLDELTWPN